MIDLFDLSNETPHEESIRFDYPENPHDKERPYRYYSDLELRSLWKIYRGESNVINYSHCEYLEIKKEMNLRGISLSWN